MTLLEQYSPITGPAVIDHLRQLAELLRGMKIVHVNSTRMGGGVAEILDKLVPLKQELGLDVRWEIITGAPDFYQCTKTFHNALQGAKEHPPAELLTAYERTNAENAEEFGSVLNDADIVFIHDPQPAPLIEHFPDRRGKWVWRCHIDVSRPNRPTWKYIGGFARQYDASIFSLADFAQPLPHTQYLIPPSIDALSDKNRELDEETVNKTLGEFGVDPERPVLVQISRYDRFKDPLGVIQSYKLVKTFSPSVQLVLAGGGASDDPEGQAVLDEVRDAAGDDPDIHVLLLPADAHVTVNALQRGADIIFQKSLREGFGLTVTEGLWKSKPVIGGNTGGIRLQVINDHTGYLVDTPEGAALRTRYLFHNPDKMLEMGRKAKEFVRENFLLTRHLREYLTLTAALLNGGEERIELM